MINNAIRPEAISKLISYSSPKLSPDGQILALVKTWINHRSGEKGSKIVFKTIPNGKFNTFVSGNNESGPKFSPNNRLLAFIRADISGKPQVWYTSISEVKSVQITSASEGVLDFVWAPGSDKIAYVAVTDSDKNDNDHVKVVNRLRYRDDTLGWRGDSHSHIFVIGLNGKDLRQITSGDWDDFCPVWSPDGQNIAFISGRSSERDFRMHTQVYVIADSGGLPRIWSKGLYNIGGIGWSPDSKRLAAIGTDDENSMAWIQGWLYILEKDMPPMAITSDDIKPLASNYPFIPMPWPLIHWGKDNSIIFIADAKGQSYIYQILLDSNEIYQLTDGGCQINAFGISDDSNFAALDISSPINPSEIRLLNLHTRKVKKITRIPGYLRKHPPAIMEKYTFKRNRYDIECRLWVPPDFDSTLKYPLILDIHGGPNSAFYDAFSINQQILATSGYLVLAVNPRGSTTYGNDFAMAVLGDWGGEDYLDLMEAITYVSQRSFVDENRLGVFGYSYGGFMSSWIVGHTNRFKAAIIGAPCIDLGSMYGTSDIGVSFGEPQWSGSPYNSKYINVERSPLTYVAKVQTPVLLLHGEVDVRCPIGQSEQYFVALKRSGKHVEFVRFPNCSHSFPRSGKLKLRQEYLRRIIGWFDRYLVDNDN